VRADRRVAGRREARRSRPALGSPAGPRAGAGLSWVARGSAGPPRELREEIRSSPEVLQGVLGACAELPGLDQLEDDPSDVLAAQESPLPEHGGSQGPELLPRQRHHAAQQLTPREVTALGVSEALGR